MKKPNDKQKQARVLAKLALKKESVQTQRHLWHLRGQLLDMRIQEIEAQIKEVRRK